MAQEIAATGESGGPPKFVIVIDRALPPGLAANAAAVLALTVGANGSGILGPDVADASGAVHPGITRLPIPILAGEAAALRELRDKALAAPGVFAAGFTRTAQRARDYADYELRLAQQSPGELDYAGLALFGDARQVASLTGGFALLR